MAKSTFQFFEEKFSQHLPTSSSYHEAFEKATEQIGFNPYKNYESFESTRSRERRKKRRV